MGEYMGMASGKLFVQRCTACIKNGFGQDRFYVGVDAKGPHGPMGQMAFEKKFYTEWYSRHKGQMGQDGFYVGVDTTRPDEPMGHIAFEKKFDRGVQNASETDGSKISFMLEWIPEGQMSQWARWP